MVITHADNQFLLCFCLWSCARWRCTAWARGSIGAGVRRRRSGSRWWSSCSAWRSWSSTAACAASPSGTGTKNCRRCPVPTFSISSESLRALEVYNACNCAWYRVRWRSGKDFARWIKVFFILYKSCSWYLRVLQTTCLGKPLLPQHSLMWHS